MAHTTSVLPLGTSSSLSFAEARDGRARGTDLNLTPSSTGITYGVRLRSPHLHDTPPITAADLSSPRSRVKPPRAQLPTCIASFQGLKKVSFSRYNFELAQEPVLDRPAWTWVDVGVQGRECGEAIHAMRTTNSAVLDFSILVYTVPHFCLHADVNVISLFVTTPFQEISGSDSGLGAWPESSPFVNPQWAQWQHSTFFLWIEPRSKSAPAYCSLL